MKHMAGRKRHSAEDIVRKLRRADELAAEGKTGEEIAAEFDVSAATLYNWRRAYGGMDPDAAKELKELREQNARLEAVVGRGRARQGRAAGGSARENSEPGRQAPRRRHAQGDVEHVRTVSMQSGWAVLVPPIDGFLRPRHPPIPTSMCGPGCVPTPPNTRAMGSGVPGRRYATMRVERST